MVPAVEKIKRHPQQGIVVQQIERPDPGLVERYSQLYSGIVLDHLGKLGTMYVDIGPVAPGMRMCGPAVTSLGPDLTVRRTAINLAEPGDVLVVAAGGVRDYACFGDGTARRMQVKGLAGAVIDGCTRDAAGIRALGFPTFALGTTARNYHYPAGGDFGAVNVDVACGGVLVRPGDVVFGDDDGVVVIPRLVAPELIDSIEEALASERAERGSWTTYPPFPVEDEMRRRGYDFR
jgi:4-hydroxy-4-methyl-2-oxoglutarate aldolase